MAVDKSRFPPEVADVYRNNALIPGAMTAMINYYRANTGMLRRWGEADTALGIENPEGYGSYVSDFTLHRLPGVSHWVQQEAPERVNEILAGWIAARLAT